MFIFIFLIVCTCCNNDVQTQNGTVLLVHQNTMIHQNYHKTYKEGSCILLHIQVKNSHKQSNGNGQLMYTVQFDAEKCITSTGVMLQTVKEAVNLSA